MLSLQVTWVLHSDLYMHLKGSQTNHANNLLTFLLGFLVTIIFSKKKENLVPVLLENSFESSCSNNRPIQ